MAEASDRATSVCSHCDRVIPISNIDSHYAYCSRNLVKCKTCGNMVSRKLIEEHFSGTHASVLDTVKWHLCGGPRRRQQQSPEFSPKSLMYGIVVTGIAVLLGSVFVGRKGFSSSPER